MTVEEVTEWVVQIGEQSYDPEIAHRMEVRLWGRVLHAIAAGAPDPAALAKAAVETVDFRFERWTSWATAELREEKQA